MQAQTLKFFSISKFVEFMRKRSKTHPGLSPKGIEQTPKELSTGAVLYYEGHDAFKNKYGKICVKPVLIDLHKYDGHVEGCIKNIYIKHQQILDMFDGQLVLNFTESKKRGMPIKKDLYFISIQFEEEEYNNIKYYPSETFTLLPSSNRNKQIIDAVRNQIVRKVPEEVELDISQIL